jgi:FkbH-like protein
MSQPELSRCEESLGRLEAQATLFASKISRVALHGIKIQAKPRHRFRVNVWRNHSIEGLLVLAEPFLKFARMEANFQLSDYDDALLFANYEPADVELLWLDSDRYLSAANSGATLLEWISWLGERILDLRQRSTAPIIIACWVGAIHGESNAVQLLADSLPGVYFADLWAACEESGVGLIDLRSAAVVGSPIGNAAQPVLARKLVCHWLAAAVLPQIKTVAVDLDHTLYQGVLGEDGIEGVVLSVEHRNLQALLKQLASRGVFLALVSRNQRGDVDELFASREDFPLKLCDFASVEVSWDPKCEALRRVSATTRVGLDTILFVDDNPGELAAVVGVLDSIQVVLGSPDASITGRAIMFYPGLWRWRTDMDDVKRLEDLRSNSERIALKSVYGESIDYFRSLNICVTIQYNALDRIARAADLSAKTNQFNLSMRRFNEAELAEKRLPLASFATIKMTDRLSDSGVIGLVVAELRDGALQIQELCISCRALGRHMEDSIIFSAISGMPQFGACDRIVFSVRHAPRNKPALDWLTKILELSETPREGEYSLPASAVTRFTMNCGVQVIHEGAPDESTRNKEPSS